MIKKTLFSLVLPLAFSLILSAPSTAAAQSSTEPLVVEADDSLQWRRDDQQYIATGNAIARQGDTTLMANVITADYVDDNTEQTEKVNITRIVGTGNAQLEENSYQARAETITYDLNENKARLEGGNVSIISADGTVKAEETIIYDRDNRLMIATGAAEILLSNGQRLNGDRIEIDVNETENDFTAIRASGNAHVFSPDPEGDRLAHAENIDYKRNTGIATLTGKVEILDGSNKMTGDKAVIDTISGVSTMTSTTGRVGGVFTP